MTQPSRGAVISSCGTYRYSLHRIWDDSRPVAVFVMLNPSTADADRDDPTIRKCVGFARSWKCGGIRVVNLFAYRATKPRDLPTTGAIVGPRNVYHIHKALEHCGLEGSGGPCVAAWGAASSHRQELRRYIKLRASALCNVVDSIPVSLECLGTAADRMPRHPLMLAYATGRQRWRGFGPLVTVHLEHDSGATRGSAWCRSDPSVAAADRESCVTTTIERDVTCGLCLEHIRTYTRTAAPESIDWFGDE